ncbi:MAG: NTP transferase domain-containing protein [Campylobacteraceae bacterium]|nr:NTP transferase domain-containing protein [Campylobacteraceae bacterium]
MKVIAVILARAGSKGIKNKNLSEVGGVSLLARAILAAKNSGIFSEIIVSTDGENIALEAQKYGAKVVYRPLSLASDSATSIDAMLHALEELSLKDGIAVLLQPTSPLRNETHIKEAFLKFKQNKIGSLISVKKSTHHPFKSIVLDGGEFRAVRELKDLESPRQLLPLSYDPNGAIYINFIEDLFKYRRFFIEPIDIYEMDQENSIDIDSLEDLQKANLVLEKKG